MSAENAGRKYGLWIVLMGLLVVGMIVTPDLWASPERDPGRQTVPPGTLTPTPDTSTPTDEPTRKPTKKPAPTDPTWTPENTPTSTPIPISTLTSTSTPIPTTAEATAGTPSPSPTGTVIASPTAVPAHTATLTPASHIEEVATPTATLIPEEQPIAEDTLAAASAQPTLATSTQPEESYIPATASPMQPNPASDVDVGSISPLFCGGIGMMMMGMVLLVVWRLRA